MDNLNKTAAVVVTWNRKDLLRQNLQCLLAQKGAECDILVFDNASTDGTSEMIEEEFDDRRIKYFNTGANLGGAGGFHVGIYQAVMLGYEYVWIMDDDSLPEPSALAELFRASKSLGDWGFLSSAVFWTDGTLCEANRPKKDLFRHISEKDLDGGPVPIRMGSFVSMLVRSDVIREVGLPIADYFIWTDDYEFSGRISKAHPCFFVPSSKVTHAMASNTRADLVTADGERAGRFRMLYRNDMHCYRQHGFEGRAYLAAKAAYTATDVLLRSEKGTKKARLGAMIQGYRDGLSFEPAVTYISDKKKKILIYTDGWGCGGIESYVISVLHNIDMNLFDVSIFSPWEDGDDWLGDELRDLGVKRYTLQSGKRPSNLKRGVLDIQSFINMFDLSSFDVFHANTTTVVGLAYCRAAKLHGVKRVIAHSHSSSYGSGGEALKAVLHSIGKKDFNRFVDVRLACSREAGDYLFGNYPFEVIPNGIDIERFRFDSSVREAVRNRLGIDSSCYLVGSIGRLAKEKDPLFQIKVYSELQRIDSDSRLLMVGSGPLNTEVDSLIIDLGLGDSVIRIPTTKSPESCYCALDAFLLPSEFEGFSISSIEAQCSGLPVLASQHLSHELAITDLLFWESKDETPSKWAHDLMILRDKVENRTAYADAVANAGFSAAEKAQRIADLYRIDGDRA